MFKSSAIYMAEFWFNLKNHEQSNFNSKTLLLFQLSKKFVHDEGRIKAICEEVFSSFPAGVFSRAVSAFALTEQLFLEKRQCVFAVAGLSLCDNMLSMFSGCSPSPPSWRPCCCCCCRLLGLWRQNEAKKKQDAKDGCSNSFCGPLSQHKINELSKLL